MYKRQVSNLPIELLDFRATPQGDVVQLDWVTATEHDNDHLSLIHISEPTRPY